jgi:hypothetical protein
MTDHPDFTMLICQFRGDLKAVVLGTIVNDDDFKGNMLVLEFPYTLNASFQGFFLIVVGNYDTEFGVYFIHFFYL